MPKSRVIALLRLAPSPPPPSGPPKPQKGRGEPVCPHESAAATSVRRLPAIRTAPSSAAASGHQYPLVERRPPDPDIRGTAAPLISAVAAAVEASRAGGGGVRAPSANVDLNRVPCRYGNCRRGVAAEAGAAESGVRRPALCAEEVEARAGYPGGHGPGLRRAGVVEGLGGREGGRGEQCRRDHAKHHNEAEDSEALPL